MHTSALRHINCIRNIEKEYSESIKSSAAGIGKIDSVRDVAASVDNLGVGRHPLRASEPEGITASIEAI